MCYHYQAGFLIVAVSSHCNLPSYLYMVAVDYMALRGCGHSLNYHSLADIFFLVTRNMVGLHIYLFRLTQSGLVLDFQPSCVGVQVCICEFVLTRLSCVGASLSRWPMEGRTLSIYHLIYICDQPGAYFV